MTKQLSFTKHEKKVYPSFRQKISMAESIEDVKKIYDFTALALLNDIFEGRVEVLSEDMVLKPEGPKPFKISKRLESQDEFKQIWENSDLPQMIDRLSETAINRWRHLEKNLKKTEAKIRK